MSAAPNDEFIFDWNSVTSPCVPRTEPIPANIEPPKRRSTIDLQRSPHLAAARRLEVNRECAKRFYQRSKSRRASLKAEVEELERQLQALLATQEATNKGAALERLVALNQELATLRDEREALEKAWEAHMKRHEMLSAIVEHDTA